MPLIESQLYAIKPHDSASLVAASAGVIAIVLAAAFLPICRAVRIDPVRALRWE